MLTSEKALQNTEKALERFYTVVSRAQALGYFKGHHGPIEETAWLHVAFHNLDEVEMLADEAIKGDVRHLARLRTLVEKAPLLKISEAPEHHTPRPQEKSFLDVHHAPLVPSAALLLDRLQDQPGTEWTRRAMGYYTIRALAVSEALIAADQALAGNLSIEQFVSVVREANFMGGGMPHGSSHREAATAPDRANGRT